MQQSRPNVLRCGYSLCGELLIAGRSEHKSEERDTMASKGISATLLIGLAVLILGCKFPTTRGAGKSTATPDTEPLIARAIERIRADDGLSKEEAEKRRIVVFLNERDDLDSFSFLFETQDPHMHHNFAQLSFSQGRAWRVGNESSQQNWIADMGDVSLGQLKQIPADADARWVKGPQGHTSAPIELGHAYWIRCRNQLYSMYHRHDFYVKFRVLTYEEDKAATIEWEYGPDGRSGS